MVREFESHRAVRYVMAIFSGHSLCCKQSRPTGRGTEPVAERERREGEWRERDERRAIRV